MCVCVCVYVCVYILLISVAIPQEVLRVKVLEYKRIKEEEEENGHLEEAWKEQLEQEEICEVTTVLVSKSRERVSITWLENWFMNNCVYVLKSAVACFTVICM